MALVQVPSSLDGAPAGGGDAACTAETGVGFSSLMLLATGGVGWRVVGAGCCVVGAGCCVVGAGWCVVGAGCCVVGAGG